MCEYAGKGVSTYISEYVKEWVGLSVYVEGCINMQKGVAHVSIQGRK